VSRLRTFTAPPFPTVEIDLDSGYWSGQIELSGKRVSMSLYVDGTVSADELLRARALIGQLPALCARGRTAIREASSEPIVFEFFEFHREEVPERLSPAAHAGDPNSLSPCGVSIHPGDDTFELVLDFAIAKAATDQVLAVAFSCDGSIHAIRHES
jgi:hypothetical protein